LSSEAEILIGIWSIANLPGSKNWRMR
jgi:hypothetical protein